MLSSKPMPPAGMSLRQLFSLCGGREAVAKACGLSRVQWTVVPDRHVYTVAKLARLPVSTVRPDFGDVHPTDE